MSFFEAATKVFQLDEGDGLPGKPGVPYRDSRGFWTIGRGHLIGNNIFQLRLSPRVIEAMFLEDLEIAIRESKLVVGDAFFNLMTRPRQIALMSMLFSLGKAKFLKFEKAIEAIKSEDWAQAGKEILDSKWSHDVDPGQYPGAGRDDRIAYMFVTGNYHPDYKITV